MIVQKPEKKRHYYVSQLQTKKNRSIIIPFEDAKIVNIAELHGDAGYTLHLWIPPDGAIDTIKQLETDVFTVVCSQQTEWFKTELSMDTLSEYFRSCLNANSVCQVTVSNLKTPRLQIVNKDVDDFADVFHTNVRELRKFYCRGALEVSGLYFYPKKFGVKLNLRNLHMYSANVATYEEVNSPYKNDVECEWEHEVDDLIALLQQDETEMHAKINRILDVKKTALGLLSHAKELKECSHEWNENLEALRSLIFKYKTGSLL